MSASTTISKLFDLTGSVALVTGAGRGIGEAIAFRLADAGASVVAADIDPKTAGATARRIVETGGKSIGLGCDVADTLQVEHAVELTMNSFGRLDILVNNAGIFPFSPATATTRELWDKVLSVNLTGAFFMAQAAAKAMSKGGKGGSIVNIASIDAVRPTGNLAHYDASKGGLVMLTRSLALEFGPLRIRVNTVEPGSIATPGAQAAMAGVTPAGVNVEELLKGFLARVPLGRMGMPEDIANAVLFLASPAASYVTGATLVVDGGYLVD